ncbi:hypothetical protein FS837_010678 [Tulasnella sp. UAMH 9824]|nr:hypothetical protein FS837_010678 [Tulasnella sp. UAMH 9824]
MPKERREQVDVTSALKNILDNYPAGSATLREILQNTDDAGAKKQTFILDTRKFSSSSLVGSELHVCQGPAIIASNDGYFKPKDWDAITTILDSSKKQDETSTGKYGLGFRSCYHVTDNPHILSGDKLLILDPHKRVEKYPGGVELDTKNTANEDGEIERDFYEDHFVTFSAVFKRDQEVYPGTAIRLPLRLEGFQSKLKTTPTTVEDARKMFKDFIKTELPEAMLFLKNITEIKLLEIDEDGNETVSATATIEKPAAVASHGSGERRKQEETSHYQINITMQIGSALPLTRSWIITQFTEKDATESGLFARRKDVTASGHLAKRLNRSQKDVEAAMSKDKLLPQVALALPVPAAGATSTSKSHGRLFTLLPLPIITGFPVHINAVFALVSSRQNLRNSIDVEAGSREELLVEWNRVIFSELVPKAWASLLEHLVNRSLSSVDVFEAWPGLVSIKDGDQGYWNPLPPRLLEEAAHRDVWPLHGRSSEYSTLKDVLVAMEGESHAPLQALDTCKISLVIVPERVFSLIEQSDFKEAILFPQAVYPHLKRNTSKISELDAGTRESICNYLVSANDIRLLLDLPLIPRVQGRYTSISARTKHVMATESEAVMFGNVDQTLLAEDLMSAKTRQLLLDDPAKRVRPVGPMDVAGYLERKVSTFDGIRLVNISNGVNTQTVEWLVKFWVWLDGWEKFKELADHSAAWSTIQNLHALPLRWNGGRAALRLVGKSAVRPGRMDSETVAALAALEIPVLHEAMSNGPAVQYVSNEPGDVVFILQNLPKNKAYTHLNQATRQTLHAFFTQQLSNHLRQGPRARDRVTLSAESRKALRTLPIFPVLSSGPRDEDGITFNVAPEGSCFVDNSVEVIPSIQDEPFISYDQGRILYTALGEQIALGEIAVLRKVVVPDIWSQQESILPALVDRLIKRLSELGADTRAEVAELAFVEVGGRAGRQCPSQVVDPKSALAGLYDAEDEVLPIGRFAEEREGSYIGQLRTFGMVRTSLTPSTIKERVARISDQSRRMRNREEKGLRLLKLLEQYAGPGTQELPSDIRGVLLRSPWVPVGSTFYKPSECWDSRWKDILLCDLVLPQISFTVTSHHLRDCLGWVRVPFTILQSQLLEILETDANSDIPREKDLDRLEAVLAELASEIQDDRLSQDDINSLVEALGDAAWVPTASRNRCVARQSTLEQIDLGTKYHPVAPSLLRSPGMENFLRQMGIHSRPTEASLLSTLREISTELLDANIATLTRDELIHTSILILEERCRTFQGSDSEFQRMLIPTVSCQLAPAAEVLFNDMGGDSTCPPAGFQFAHPQVSLSLAYDLSIRRLSEEEFSQAGDDIESFHMGEDLTVRIRGVLQDYDIDHSGNEWVANADDAGASSVTFLVDEATFEGRRIIPGLKDFQSGPALVVHNDGVFTEDDFTGLRNIGQGGKSGRTDSIGRFGLGALSFYHFTDTPPNNIWPAHEETHYQDQLKPLEGLFGFRSKDEYFNGTLFRFPLRAATEVEAATGVESRSTKLSDAHFSAVDITDIVNRFYNYASESLFFTKNLTEIAALRRTEDFKTTSVWSVKSSREIIQVPQRNIDAVQLSLQMQAPRSKKVVPEQWLVTKAQVGEEEFPERFDRLFTPHRLPTPSSGLALNLSPRVSPTNSRLFATLPLPVSTSLPVHINATWILAQDRRSIRYDAPDAAGQRPLDTLYNEHLLRELIAPLYVKTLALVLLHHPTLVRQFWPGKAQDGPSQIIATEVHNKMISTTEKVLLSTQDQPVSPTNAIIHLTRKVPSAVRTVLTELQVPNYVPCPYFDTSFLKDWGCLSFDVANQVSRILGDSNNVAALKKLWLLRNPTEPAFTFKEITSITDYLLKEGENLNGLPLLLRGDGQIVEFKSSGHPKIFASHRRDLARLFNTSVIVNLDLSDAAAQGLAKLNLNVAVLDPQGMRDLLADQNRGVTPKGTKIVDTTEIEWHKRLLEFLASPACPVTLEDLADLPLLPAFGRELVVSLSYAQSGKLWWKYPYEDRRLTTILRQLDVVEVDVLPGGMPKAEKVDLARILQLFGQLNLSPAQILQKVTTTDWNAFIQYINFWIQAPYIQSLSPAEFQTLTTLPLFQGIHGADHLTFVSANQVLMLPASVRLDVIARYLPSGTTFAEHSSQLAAIFQMDKNTNKQLSFENLLSRLRIPSQLTQDEDESFSELLELITVYHVGQYNNPLIPDGDRVVRRPSELFDHRVDVFSTAFEGSQDLFVHPNFRSLADRLVNLGVQQEVTSQRLLQCLRAVDRDVQRGQEPVRRATRLWDYINTAPPQMRQIPFETIRRLRFLPRQSQRHPSDSDFDTYARDLPNVVSLDDLCAPEHEAVVWTQRARFSSFPSAHLKAVYPNVGEPTSVDVVQHLVSLVNNVAPNHHQSSIFRGNLQSVYDWLKDKKEAANSLPEALSKQPLWLNINSDLDNWTWKTADELVFDLTNEVERRFSRVGKFLLPYRSLLLDAGAHEYRPVIPPSITTSSTKNSHSEAALAGWNDLRKAGQLLDICFQVDGQKIPAHRGMLAATMEHFRDAFTGPFMESLTLTEGTELPVYRLLGEHAESAFSLQAIVDYAYTGTFTRPTIVDPDDAKAALEDLFSLAKLSHCWRVSDLEIQAVQAIVALRLIRLDNCDKILERAEKCQIDALVTVCQETKKQNPWAR